MKTTNVLAALENIVLFTNFQASYYGSSSGGGKKSGDNKFIDFFVSWVGTRPNLGMQESADAANTFVIFSTSHSEYQ